MNDCTPVALWVINKSCRKWGTGSRRGGSTQWGKRSMRLLIISVAKARYWVQCQLLQALDLLHRLNRPDITMYIQVYSLHTGNGFFRAASHSFLNISNYRSNLGNSCLRKWVQLQIFWPPIYCFLSLVNVYFWLLACAISMLNRLKHVTKSSWDSFSNSLYSWEV